MALSFTDYTATASQTDFTIPFPFLDSDHVKVTIDGVVSSAFTVVTSPSNLVRLTTGATLGAIVRVYRETPGTTTGAKVMLIDFEDGSVLTESDLDTACQQLLYIAQEYGDDSDVALKADSTGAYDASSQRIINVANAVDSQDAVTYGVFNTSLTAVGGVTISEQSVHLATSQAATFSTDTIVTITGVTLNTYVENRMICTVGGVVQRPTTDFTVELSGSNTLLKLKGEDITSGGTLTVPVTLQIPY